MRNARQGFTVIELMIVVAVIALLAVALLPNLTGAQRSANISAVESGLTRAARAQQTFYTRCNTYFHENQTDCFDTGEDAHEVWNHIAQFDCASNINVTFGEGERVNCGDEAHHTSGATRLYHITLDNTAKAGDCP